MRQDNDFVSRKQTYIDMSILNLQTVGYCSKVANWGQKQEEKRKKKNKYPHHILQDS